MEVDLEMVLASMFEADLRLVSGSIDGDMPALMRYSQALADRVSERVIEEIDGAMREMVRC